MPATTTGYDQAADAPPTLPVMETYVLLDGTFRDSGRALAAAVFELAQQGHLRIDADPDARTVTLTRTAAPGAELPVGQQDVLVAVFTELDCPGEQLTVSSRGEWPVAPVVMARARTRLLAQGRVSPVRPRTVRRVVAAVLAGLGLLGLGAVALVTRAAGPVFYTGCLLLAAAVVLPGLDVTRRRQVVRTRAGRAAVRRARRIRRRCRGTRGPRRPAGVPSVELAQELLWSIVPGDGLPSVSGMRERPSWWEGQWPDVAVPGSSFHRAYRVLVRALAPSPQDLAALRAGPALADRDRELPDDLIDPIAWWGLVQDVRSLDLSDWGGSSGEGSGDGDGDGDGG